MKTCSTCKVEKPLSEFHYKHTEKRHNSMCKKCFSAYCMKRWTDRKIKAIERKGGCCSHCGYNKYIGALEFHHLNPSDKEFNWNKMRLLPEEKIFRELDKCILLCSNCHREVHANK